ncbi:MAG: helix-hairpin-helix domain-containing protein [Chitinophagaceae bacterium]|nr:helix-hairpin-helix domain-containing protein [Chitinophagaceae bacterium]
MQKKSRAYDQFSKKERIGILVCLIIVVLLLLLPYLIPRKPLPDLLVMTAEGKKWKELLNDTMVEQESNADNIHFYPFDPNHVSVEEWQILGMPTTVAKRIMNYLHKGGRFRKAEDLRKIWGMPPSLADQLIPYVRIKQQIPEFKKKIQTIQPIDINTADIEAWKSLPGIGNVLAERIIKYREKVNGFGHKEELRAIYGLSDSLLVKIDPYLQIHESSLQKIPLNRASAYQIAIKTSIPIEIAKNIVRWRQENGSFTDMNQLLTLPGFKPEWMDRFKALFFIE